MEIFGARCRYGVSPRERGGFERHWRERRHRASGQQRPVTQTFTGNVWHGVRVSIFTPVRKSRA